MIQHGTDMLAYLVIKPTTFFVGLQYLIMFFDCYVMAMA